MIGLADQNIVKLASAVRVNEEPRFPLLERLNRCAEGEVEFSEALDCVQLVMGSVLLALKMTAEFDAAHARQLDPHIGDEAIADFVAESVCRCYEWVGSYAQKMMDVYCAQRDYPDADSRFLLYHFCKRLPEAAFWSRVTFATAPSLSLPRCFSTPRGAARS